MSEADVKKQIDEDVKDFSDVYITDVPHEHRLRLMNKLVASAFESKETDAWLGFMSTAEFLDDIAIDAPKAFDYMAVMLM
ncbi:hypothetical protein EDB19DRAFT_1749441, partial [Suillus lakei]